MKCDFCSEPDPTHRYSCHDITVPEVQFHSVGDFMACDTCAGLIEAKERDALFARSIETYRERHHLPDDPRTMGLLNLLLHSFQDQFWKSRGV